MFQAREVLYSTVPCRFVGEDSRCPQQKNTGVAPTRLDCSQRARQIKPTASDFSGCPLSGDCSLSTKPRKKRDRRAGEIARASLPDCDAHHEADHAEIDEGRKGVLRTL